MSSSERTGNKYRILPELFSRDLEREREFGISDLRIYGYEAEAGMMRIGRRNLCRKRYYERTVPQMPCDGSGGRCFGRCDQ